MAEWNDGIDLTRMSYNAQGQRVKKIVTGLHPGVYLESYDDQGRLLGVYSPDGNGGLTVVEELVYLDGWRTVATIRPDASLGMSSPVVYPIVSDPLGSPRKIMTLAGSLVWSWTNTEPYGNQTPNEMESANRFIFDGRFPGQRFDASTGALHNGFRTYSPRIGRYMQSDPLGLAAGWNTYGYVGGSPIYFIDPLGLEQLNLFSPSEKSTYNGANVHYSKHQKNGTWSVYAHAGFSTPSMTPIMEDDRIGNGDVLTVKGVILRLKQAGWKPGEPVEFYACHAGADRGNGIMAQQFSKMTHTKSKAATNFVWFNQSRGIIGIGRWAPNTFMGDYNFFADWFDGPSRMREFDENGE